LPGRAADAGHTPSPPRLANPGDEAVYTFTATAGQRLFYNATVISSGIDALLPGPVGAAGVQRECRRPERAIHPPRAGPYSLVIYGKARRPATKASTCSSQPCRLPLDAGHAGPAALANPGDQGRLHLHRHGGPAAFYNATVTSSGIDALLQGPSAEQVFNVNAAGQYGRSPSPSRAPTTLTIYGSGSTTGGYGFDLRRPALPVAPLTLGTPSAVRWPTRHQAGLHLSTGTVGHRITYDAAHLQQQPDRRLVQSSSAPAHHQNAANDTGFTLPENGNLHADRLRQRRDDGDLFLSDAGR